MSDTGFISHSEVFGDLGMNDKMRDVRISVPAVSYQRVRDFAGHSDCDLLTREVFNNLANLSSIIVKHASEPSL